MLKVSLQGHSGAVNCLEYNKEGAYLLSSSADKLIKLWNPATGLCIKTYSGHGYQVLDTKISKDNTKFTSGGGDKSVYLWDVATGNIIRRFSGHAARINTVDFNEECTVIASGSYDASIRFWDLRSNTFAPIQVISDAKDSVSGLQINNNQILVSSIDGFSRLYDIRTGSCTIDDVGIPITWSRLSNDDNCVLVSTLDSTIRLFDKEDGKVLSKYSGHLNLSYQIKCDFSHDDSLVASGSEDGRVFVWDLVECGVLHSDKVHNGIVGCTVFHPKMNILATGGGDGSIKILQL